MTSAVELQTFASMSGFTWFLGIQTQILPLEQEALSPEPGRQPLICLLALLPPSQAGTVLQEQCQPLPAEARVLPDAGPMETLPVCWSGRLFTLNLFTT